MAQERLRDYKEPILSFDHNIFNLGMHNPGRYCGFDTLDLVVPGGGAPVVECYLKHTATGFKYKNPTNDTIGPCGVALSAQGVLVLENDKTPKLTFDANTGNSFRRYDLVIMTHTQVVVAGGNAATYSIIKGPVGSELKPVLSDPLTQVAIATIEFQPNGDLATAILHKAKCPDSGDGEDARLNTPNVFKAIQLFNTSATQYTVPTHNILYGGANARLWEFENDGNMFEVVPGGQTTLEGIKIKDMPLQPGTRIVLMITDKIILQEHLLWGTDARYAQGFRPLRIPYGLGNVTTTAMGGGIKAIRPLLGEIWSVELMLYQDRWFVMSISGVGDGGTFKQGDTIMWYGDVNTAFNANGLGINLKTGWAICNGAIHNGVTTPDMRGKLIAMSTEVPSAGRPDLSSDAAITASGLIPGEYIVASRYFSVGQRSHVLTQSNLPNCNFSVTDPGHTHSVPGNWGGSAANGDGKSTVRPNANVAMPNTGLSYTGITVASGGSDTPVIHIPPCFMHVMIMKL